MRESKPGRRFRAPLLAGLAFTLFGVVPSGPGVGAATFEPCTDPPPIFRLRNLEPGMMGTGWTVVQGTEPVSFDVEILGIWKDGIAPDVDMIMARLSGDVVAETGMAYGFSGSPVYIDGKLVGATSYGFFGDPWLAGLTPAKPMIEILQYPTTYGKDAARTLRSAPSETTVPNRLRTRIADQLGVRASAVPETIYQLKVPVGISGVPNDVLEREQKRLDRLGIPAVVYRGGSAKLTRTTAAEPFAPGDSMAAVFSFGDVTYGGYATATAVCGDMVVGWGHIFDHSGQTRSVGMIEAPVVATVPDLSYSWGSYKLAIPGELHGVIDQDRWTGIRGIEGLIPRVMPVVTDVTNTDTGKRRVGETDIVAKGGWIRWITWDHFYSALHFGLDAHRGSVDMTWTINGVFEGEPFSMTRSDKFAGYVLWQASYEPYQNLRIIQQSGFKPVKLTSVEGTATVTEDVMKASIRRPWTASSLEPTLAKRRRLDVAPGDTIRVVVPLAPSDDSGLIRVPFEIDVPDRARGDGWLRIEDGDPPYRVKANTFNQLINRLEAAEHHSDLVAWFKLDSMDKAIKLRLPQDWYLTGDQKRVRVVVIR